jgi:hypothetical protein
MDDADKAEGLIEARQKEGLAAARRAAADMPKGEPGDCELCGEWSGRLVRGVCAPCRDRFKLG